jgi:hypothetical protein
MGAFAHRGQLEDSISHELSLEKAVQVAAEPLFDGRCRLTAKAEIGLLVDQSRTLLIEGFATDAWTEQVGQSGRLTPTRKAGLQCRQWSELPKIGRTQKGASGHGEVIVQGPIYSNIVVRFPRKKLIMNKARRLGERFKMPCVDTQGLPV